MENRLIAEESIEEPVNVANASTVERKNRPKRKAAPQGELIRNIRTSVKT